MGTEQWKAALGERLLTNEPLARHTTFGLGGPAEYYVVVHSAAELRDVVRLAWEQHMPYLLLGSGANVLVSDQGVRGLVIHNCASVLEFSGQDDGRTWWLQAESGALLRHAARQAVERGLAGLEWAVDVPGTVGGAVVGNAGAYGGYVSDSLRGAQVLTPEQGEQWWPSQQLGLMYRSSVLKKGRKAAEFASVILWATFVLHVEAAAVLQAKAGEYSKRRGESQPQGMSAGSVFKRTDQYPAGFLIENAGLKGARVGGAVVSPQHANFIINTGTATAQDVRELIELIRTTVYARFKIMLELEIELVGEW